MKIRFMALIMALVMIASALAGCGGSSAPQPPVSNKVAEAVTSNEAEKTEEPKKDEEIVITMGTNTAFTDFRPYRGWLVVDRLLTGMYFDRLFHATPNGDFTPRGADSWEVAEDRMSITFHLSKDAVWTDGHPVTAHDYEFGAIVATTEGNPATAQFGYHYATLVGVSDSTKFVDGSAPLGVEVIDDYTIKYIFKKPYVEELEMTDNVFNFIALPKHLLENEDPTKYLDWEYWNDPVTNGPLTLESQIPGSEIVFAKNETYHRGAPKFDKLKVVFMDAGNMTSALMAGDIDIAYPSPVYSDIEMLRGQDGINIFELDYPTMMRAIFISSKNVPDARVRKALSMAIDREAACAAHGNCSIMSTTIAPNSPYYKEEYQHPYDPEAARALLEEAAADGAFDFDKTYKLACTAGVGQITANLAQQYWAEIGVKVEQVLMENTALINAVNKEHTVDFGTMNRMHCYNPVAEFSGGTVFKDTFTALKEEYIMAPDEATKADVIARWQEAWLETPGYIVVGGAHEHYAYTSRVNDGGSIGQESAMLGSFNVWEWNVTP